MAGWIVELKAPEAMGEAAERGGDTQQGMVSEVSSY